MSITIKTFKLILKMLVNPLQRLGLGRYHLARVLLKKVYSKIAPEEYILVDIQGIKFYMNTLSDHTVRCLLQHGVYEPGTTKIFRNIVKDGMIVIDVGAESGYYSLLASKLVGSNGKVFAFEPHPFYYNLLIKNIKYNNINNIIPVSKAASNRTGTAKLYTEGTGGSLIGSGRYIEVETIALDEFFEKYNIVPDIVKIDTDGAELLVLEGMEETIKKSKNLKMIVECNNDELIDFLKNYFNIYHINKEGQLIPFKELKESKVNYKIYGENLYCERLNI